MEEKELRIMLLTGDKTGKLHGHVNSYGFFYCSTVNFCKPLGHNFTLKYMFNL